MASSSEAQAEATKVPACDWCREKKIKCGREKPQCKNCTQRKVECIYSERQKRDNENSRTAQMFSEVHERLDRMESTMARIANALEIKHIPESPWALTRASEASSQGQSQFGYRESQSMSSSPETNDAGHPRTTEEYNGPQQELKQRASSSARAQSFVEDVEGNAYYYGGTSFLAISSEATDSAILAKSPAPSAPIQLEELTDIQEKVAGLMGANTYVQLNNQLPSTDQKFWIPDYAQSKLIVAKFFRATHYIFPIHSRKNFMRQMDAMYGNRSAAVDVGWLITYLNALIFGIYGECNNVEQLVRESRAGTGRMKFMEKAQKATWEYLDDTSTLLKPRLANVKALMTMAAGANEISRPGLCWMLLCNACSLAKAIGLHRTHHESSYPSEIKFSSADLAERRYVFWTLYIMDKSLSLTFGRPSSLPDFDIDVELPDFDPENPLWDLYIAWIESAKVQSEIQVKLYSASALKLHTEEKRRNVIDLDGKWRGWWMRYSSLLGRRSREEAFERKYVMTELMFCYHNTMIMIHRVNTQKNDGGKSGDNPQVSGSGVVRGSPMESEMLCLEHARKGINMIRDTISQKSSLARSGLMMWLFSYYPFTSFFILFSNIIRNPNLATSKDDFRLLTFIVEFLNSMKIVHAGAAKLVPLAESFLRIAARFFPVDDAVISDGPSLQNPLRKRKLGDTSHNPMDDGMRSGMEPTPMGTDYVDLNVANFITWPASSQSQPPWSAMLPSSPMPGMVADQPQNRRGSSNKPHTAQLQGGVGINYAEYDFSNFMDTADNDSGLNLGGSGSLNDSWFGTGGNGEFQDRIESAANEGPLDFNWFEWEKFNEEDGSAEGRGTIW